MKQPFRSAVLSFGLLFFAPLAFAQEGNKEPVSQHMEGNIFRPRQLEVSDQLIKQLKLPAGFTIAKYAENLTKPRMMAVGPDGTVYVTSREAGTVTLLQDKDRDGKAEVRKTVATKDQLHGIAISRQKMYLITVNEVYTADIQKDGTLAPLKEIMKDLPDGGQHGNRTLAIGPDNNLYVSVGSTCNACDETNKENATLLQAKPDGTSRRIYAKGLRNTIGFGWHPQTKALYGLDHGIDWLGDEEQPEELNRITDGADYGWPYVYANGKFEKHHDPKGMTHEQYAAKTTKPELLFDAHSAPMNLLFYTGSQFPKDYNGDALATFHGSWNRKDPAGYKVMRIRFENGKPAKAEDFITGFLTENNTAQFARVCGLAQLPDGSVLVSDDGNGMIYRISYSGKK